MIQLNTLRPNPKNPRVIKDDKFRRLVDSLRTFPKMMSLRPIIADEEGIILGGNMRFKALLDLGYTEVPDEWVKFTTDMTEEEKKEFLIKDNVNYGEWDTSKLLLDDWDKPKLIVWGLTVEQKDEKEMIRDDNYEPPITVTTDIKEGDYFEIGQHRLLCGDSRSIGNWKMLMQEHQIDLMLTDPPYNVNYQGEMSATEARARHRSVRSPNTSIINDNMCDAEFYNFLLQFFIAGYEHTKPGGAWYVFHADVEGRNFRNAFEASGLLMKQCLIWKKNSLVLGRQDYQWIHEPILYGWKPGAAHYFTPDRTQTTVWEEPIPDYKRMPKPQLLALLEEIFSEKSKLTVTEHDKPRRNFEHPTMKPILLVGELIANSSQKGDIIADGFGGSGPTMIAAEQLQRRAFLMELDPKYCQVIIDRMKKHTPGITIKKLNADGTK